MFVSLRSLSNALTLIACILVLSACGHDDHDHNHNNHDHNHHDDELSLGEEACLHAQSGPFEATTASESADAVSGTVKVGHTANVIALNSSEEAGDIFYGVVGVQIDDDGEYHFFASSDMPVQLLSAATLDEIEWEQAVGVEDCVEITNHYVADLEIGDYFLTFGDTVESEIVVIVERGDSAHHH